MNPWGIPPPFHAALRPVQHPAGPNRFTTTTQKHKEEPIRRLHSDLQRSVFVSLW
jgi:hypothetical protein